MSKDRVFSGPYFPVFSSNTKRKIQNGKNSVFGRFTRNYGSVVNYTTSQLQHDFVFQKFQDIVYRYYNKQHNIYHFPRPVTKLTDTSCLSNYIGILKKKYMINNKKYLIFNVKQHIFAKQILFFSTN